MTASGTLTGGGGSNVTRYAKVDAGASKTVTVRLATSLISWTRRRRTRHGDPGQPHLRPGPQRGPGRLGPGVLGRVEVDGATADQLTTLYSNLYRLHLYPNSAFENTGTAAAPKYQYASPVQPAGREHADADRREGRGRKMYVNNGFWDTYRTTGPAYSLLTPNKAAEMVDGFVQQYRDGGWIARWSSPGYANLATGTSSDVAFADAYTKGVPLQDVQSTYEAAVRNATVTLPGNPNNSNVGRKGCSIRLPRLHADHRRGGRVLGSRGLHQRLRHREDGREAVRRYAWTRRPATDTGPRPHTSSTGPRTT